MTVTTRPPRVAPRPEAPAAPDSRARSRAKLGIGRARAYPLRREGPAKLTGDGAVHRRPRLPRCVVRPHDPLDRCRTRDCSGIDLDPAFDWSKVVVLTAKDMPGRQRRQPHHGRPAGPRRRRDPPPRRAGRAAGRARSGDAARGEGAHHAADRAAPRGLRSARGDPGVRPLRAVQGRHRRRLRAGRAGDRGHLPRRPPGAAVHREQRDDRRAAAGRRRHDPRLAAVPVLHPQGDEARARADRLAGRVIQAETGGGFGGKEEYPSVIAIHAALLALRVGKPVRMIYDRHEDLAATTKRHPAIVTHRTGVMQRRHASSPRTSRSSWTAAPTAR